MKKRIISIALILVMLLSSSIYAAAAGTREATATPILSFNNTAAICTVSIRAIGKTISAVLQLWNGSQLIGSWTGGGNSLVTISGTCPVSHGQTYTLIVSGTIDGAFFTGTPVSAACP